MIKRTYIYAIVSSMLALSCNSVIAAPMPNKTVDTSNTEIDITKLSEAFGHFIGKNLKNSGLNFNVDSLIQGLKNGNDGKPSPMSEQEYEKGMLALQEKAIKKISEDNLVSANKFLSENANKEGIVILEPGKLQYVVVAKGDGAEVQEHGTPKIEYKGQYIDGTVFGNSQESGGPIDLPLDQTIPGFSKAIKGMKEGETRRIFVHPDLGYGTTGQLPPNSLLIFEVKVIKAESPKEDREAALNKSLGNNAFAELDVRTKSNTSKSLTGSTGGYDNDDDIDDEDDDEDLDDDDDYDDEDEDDYSSTPSKK